MNHQRLGLGDAEAKEGGESSQMWAPVKPRMLSGGGLALCKDTEGTVV